MNGSPQKPLIERRRRHPDANAAEHLFQNEPPHNRRSSDELRMRFQRWIELADIALHRKPKDDKNGHKH